jgi:SNF2 family DNA or RNA helicase
MAETLIGVKKTINLYEKTRFKPYDHQVQGVQWLLQQPHAILADEMGLGKTKQTIDYAQILYECSVIDRVLIICPAAVRPVWFDPELGELKKHLWEGFPSKITEYHSKIRTWLWGKPQPGVKVLEWLITNYDFIRPKNRLHQLLPYATHRTLLVLDESSAVKNHRAVQTKACLTIRKKLGPQGRVLELNGTPIPNNPLDLYSQTNILNPFQNPLQVSSYFHFRARYAIMGGWQNKQIIGWVQLDDLQRRCAPYIMRRLKMDCLDLPPKLPPVTMTVPLTPETWKPYKEMRDDMVAWLGTAEASAAPQAVVKALRLAQITSGFLGGVEERITEDTDVDAAPPVPFTREIGKEKQNLFLEWLDLQLEENPNFKLLVWSRFRAEIARLVAALKERHAKMFTGLIWGGQKKEERDWALRLLDPRTSPNDRPIVVIGTPGSGSMGLNLTAAHHVMDLSYDYNMKNYLQAQDRVHRPGQTQPVWYGRIVATGPQGQKTIDHHIIKAREGKVSLADMTLSAWIQAIQEE